jgi:Ser-tRNA(Ala) deacylase AlaX
MKLMDKSVGDIMSETNQLYQDDSYQKEFDAIIIDMIETTDTNSGNKSTYVVLDQTLFYPKGGGQPCDTGILQYQDVTYAVLEVIKSEGRLLHRIDMKDLQELKKGQRVHGVMDWDRRYTLMRMHTAAHLIDAVLYRDGKIMVTGNQLDVDKSRIDFDMPDFSLEKVQEYISEANVLVSKNLEVKNYYLPREEAFMIPGIVKLAGALPPDIPVLRITEIVGLDIQADGGTHVRHLGEIGKINILNIENKGKGRKRICYTITR